MLDLDYAAKLISKRMSEATDKRIAARAYSIVELLSTVASRQWTRNGTDVHEESGDYHGKDFKIHFYHQTESSPCGGGGSKSYTHIMYDDKLVFAFENGKITSYVPGKWETAFDELSEEADAAFAQREEEHSVFARKQREEEETKLRAELKAKWGIEI